MSRCSIADRAGAWPAYRRMLKPAGWLRVRPATACCAAGLAPATPTGSSRGPIRAAGHANASTASTPISGSTTETTISRRHGKNFASVFHIP
jgi:hypothetical protein